jgi:hypothetical protein
MTILFIYYTDILVGTLVLYILDRRETVLRELGKNPSLYISLLLYFKSFFL